MCSFCTDTLTTTVFAPNSCTTTAVLLLPHRRVSPLQTYRHFCVSFSIIISPTFVLQIKLSNTFCVFLIFSCTPRNAEFPLNSHAPPPPPPLSRFPLTIMLLLPPSPMAAVLNLFSPPLHSYVFPPDALPPPPITPTFTVLPLKTYTFLPPPPNRLP